MRSILVQLAVLVLIVLALLTDPGRDLVFSAFEGAAGFFSDV